MYNAGITGFEASKVQVTKKSITQLETASNPNSGLRTRAPCMSIVRLWERVGAPAGVCYTARLQAGQGFY
jgi:hypothetical protein